MPARHPWQDAVAPYRVRRADALGCRRECALSALVRVDRAASVAERAFDLLAPAALSTVATKTTEHMIEDIVTMSGSMTFWAGELSIAVAVRAGGLRHDRCSFPCFALSTWERSTAIETHVTRTVGTSHDQGFRERLISSLPDSPPTENSTQTRTETTKTPGAFRGTDGSNPVFSYGESPTNRARRVPPEGRQFSDGQLTQFWERPFDRPPRGWHRRSRPALFYPSIERGLLLRANLEQSSR